MGLIKAMPRDRRRLNQHFFSGYLCLKTGEEGWGLFYTYFAFNVFAGKVAEQYAVKRFIVTLRTTTVNIIVSGMSINKMLAI